MRVPKPVAALVALCAAPVLAAPPGDVGPTLTIAADGESLSWGVSAGAERYNLYRGAAPDAADLVCLVFRTPSQSASDSEVPPQLATYLVAGWSAAEGEGTLGTASGGAPRTALVRCADDDLDGVRDDQDNCPGLANPGQLDQDANAVGDPCDPRTYDFEGDASGARPAAVTQEGGADATFLVRGYGAPTDRGASYDGGTPGVHDLFDRLPSGRPRQDLDVYVDAADLAGEELTLELWSEGTHVENAGGGVQFRLQADGAVAARVRAGQALTDLGSATLASRDRLRLRLRKDAGTQSTLHVDRWTGSAWSTGEASFVVADDHALFGDDVSSVNYGGGREPVLRITGVALQPAGAFSLRKSHDGLADWKLFQRGPLDTAPVPVRFSYAAAEAVRLEVSVVDAASGVPLPGFDFPDHVFALPAAPTGADEEVSVPDVPAGGNYDVETRLVAEDDGAILGSETVSSVAVGDVFLAAGQSNMSGYSGGLGSAEPPDPQVHLFGNDYVWKQGAEPMDDGTDQVDRVSGETPAHSLMLRFGKEVAAASGVPVAVIPAPLGGTNLNSQWQRNDGDPTNRGTLYGSSIHRVLAQGYAHPIRGVLWYQGESDVGRTTAQYRQDLENLVADYRNDLGDASLFFGNCQLATNQGAELGPWIAIQEAQRQQAEADPLSAVVALMDQPRSDTVHLSVDGYKTAGLRLARAVLDGEYGLPQPLGPQIVSVAADPAVDDRIVVTYDKDVSGGAPFLYQVVKENGQSISITAVTTSGPEVLIDLQRRIMGSVTLSYGSSFTPSDPWVVATDGSGAALAFDALPVQP